MDPAAILIIAYAIIISLVLNLVVTVAALTVFYSRILPTINRRVDLKLANSRRFALAQKRQTVTAIGKAVDGFSEQTRFVNERCETAVTECIKAVNTTRDDMVKQIKGALSQFDDIPRDPTKKTPLPFSVEVIRKRAEDRLVEEIRENKAQPVGAK